MLPCLRTEESEASPLGSEKSKKNIMVGTYFVAGGKVCHGGIPPQRFALVSLSPSPARAGDERHPYEVDLQFLWGTVGLMEIDLACCGQSVVLWGGRVPLLRIRYRHVAGQNRRSD